MNHGKRRATGINAIRNGSRVRSEAIHAHATTAIPSAKLVRPEAATKRLKDWFDTGALLQIDGLECELARDARSS